MQSFEKLFLTFDSQPVSRKKKLPHIIIAGARPLVACYQRDARMPEQADTDDYAAI